MRTQIPETSKIARAKFISEGKENAHEKLILKALSVGDYTAYQIGQLTGLDSIQVSRRTIKLERTFKIIRTGEKRKDSDGSFRLVYSLLNDK